MNSQPPLRPFRRDICDGDDVWPGSLTDDELHEIAAIDAMTRRGEPERSSKISEMLGDAPVFSLAERVRHWIDLVDDTETASHLAPGEFMTELGCRELVADKLATGSTSLRHKVVDELPLDERFKLATFDDGGAALAREVKINDRQDKPGRWNRRPHILGPLWGSQPD